MHGVVQKIIDSAQAKMEAAIESAVEKAIRAEMEVMAQCVERAVEEVVDRRLEGVVQVVQQEAQQTEQSMLQQMGQLQTMLSGLEEQMVDLRTQLSGVGQHRDGVQRDQRGAGLASGQVAGATQRARQELQSQGHVIDPGMEQVLQQAVRRQTQAMLSGSQMEQAELQDQLKFDQTHVRARARNVNAQKVSDGSRPDF